MGDELGGDIGDHFFLPWSGIVGFGACAVLVLIVYIKNLKR